MAPTAKTKRLLDMVSKNRCAFTDCSEILTDYDTTTVLGERCHIKGEKPTSARYDPTQTPKERESFENLVMMCCKHHKIIDARPDIYTVEVLLDMKRKHEESLDVSPAFISDALETVKQGLADIKGLISKRGRDEE